jgi:hypothetical protein
MLLTSTYNIIHIILTILLSIVHIAGQNRGQSTYQPPQCPMPNAQARGGKGKGKREKEEIFSFLFD